MQSLQNTDQTQIFNAGNPEHILHPVTKKLRLSSSESELIYVKNHQYENGDSYQGFTMLGKRQGFGKYYNNGGDLRYEGEFENDQRQGKGKFFDPAGVCRYDGEWMANIGEGKGKMFMANGKACYDGEFHKGKMHGKGKSYSSFCITFGNGKKTDFFYMNYIGEFSDNKKASNGRTYHINGVVKNDEKKNAGAYVKNFKLCKNMYGEIVGFE